MAVVYGGPSSEHDVSVASARAVIDHLPKDRYEVEPVYITRDGVWTYPEYADDTFGRTMTRGGPALISAGAALVNCDVVFPVMHGEFGEDGRIQGMLEMARIPYVGCGVLASSAGMYKDITKFHALDAGLPVAMACVLPPATSSIDYEDQERLGLPVFVKPAVGGSSIGVTKVTNWADLDSAIAAARKHHPTVLVEEAVDGREVEVGVVELPNGELRTSFPAEILPDVGGGEDGWYDYATKYEADVSAVDVPAKLDPKMVDSLRLGAEAMFRALKGSGLMRVDFFVMGDDKLAINEVNTMPGFTEKSVFPLMWHATGMAFPELLDTLVQNALRRRRR